MDPEPEMLAVGRENAADLPHVQWVEGSSADVSPALGQFRLVAMGASFHWMDRAATLRALEPLAEALVVASSPSVWNQEGAWQEAVREVVQRWLGERRRAGSGTYTQPPERHADIIARSAFRRIETYTHTWQRELTVDAIVGQLYSTSFCSVAVLGEKREPFEADLQATLAQVNPAGMFREEIRLEALLAWRVSA